jgi:hypothetical protein
MPGLSPPLHLLGSGMMPDEETERGLGLGSGEKATAKERAGGTPAVQEGAADYEGVRLLRCWRVSVACFWTWGEMPSAPRM